MNDFERQFRDWMRKAPRPDPQRSQTFREEVIHNYDEKLKKVERYAWWWLLGIIAGFAVSGTMMGRGAASSLPLLIYGGVFFLLVGQLNVLIKLWYWMMNVKLNVLREIQDLRLQLLEERQGTPGGAASDESTSP